MPAAVTDKLFARIRLIPAPGGTWVVRAARPVSYQLGMTYAELEIAFEPEKARIYVMETAIQIRDNLIRLFPRSKLEPATFEQWVEQETE